MLAAGAGVTVAIVLVINRKRHEIKWRELTDNGMGWTRGIGGSVHKYAARCIRFIQTGTVPVQPPAVELTTFSEEIVTL